MSSFNQIICIITFILLLIKYNFINDQKNIITTFAASYVIELAI